MSYLEFHFFLILPPILILWSFLPTSLASFGGYRARVSLPLIALIAFVYTTPWDNYLVASEVWWYSPNRVIATIGAVPVEEYLFFLLQPFLTGLFCYQYLMRASPALSSKQRGHGAAAWGGFVVFGMLSGLGAAALWASITSATYLALILVWACPLLAGMWLYDGETLWAHRTALFFAVGLPTLYLWVADTIAISLDIWIISERYTLGIAPFGLPIEEATFFLVTNLLVVKGILLLLYGSHGSAAPPASSTRLEQQGL
jgi:lycopene cyclase domain-containing protein